MSKNISMKKGLFINIFPFFKEKLKQIKEKFKKE